VAGLVPAIHGLRVDEVQDAAARHEAGHDEGEVCDLIESRIAGVN